MRTGRLRVQLASLFEAGLPHAELFILLDHWSAAASEHPLLVDLTLEPPALVLAQRDVHLPTASAATVLRLTSWPARRVGGRMHGWDLPPVSCLSWSAVDAARSAAVTRATRESGNGDAYSIVRTETMEQVAVIDGLGHGAAAAEASARIVEALESSCEQPLELSVRAADAAARATRGAALLVVRHHLAEGVLESIGVGNISGGLFGPRPMALSSRPGVVGHRLPDLHVQRLDATPGSWLIMASDGCDSRLTASQQSEDVDLPARDLAYLLHARHARSNDDATVLVHRLPAEADHG
ncbi:MAG: SpoIIE family protein phosphatase [Deltaproteobacteria bacterium]|nr:SpoIIE family protein phosphatase [Deltaproteobacteria bacterium]